MELLYTGRWGELTRCGTLVLRVTISGSACMEGMAWIWKWREIVPAS